MSYIITPQAWQAEHLRKRRTLPIRLDNFGPDVFDEVAIDLNPLRAYMPDFYWLTGQVFDKNHGLVCVLSYNATENHLPAKRYYPVFGDILASTGFLKINLERTSSSSTGRSLRVVQEHRGRPY